MRCRRRQSRNSHVSAPSNRRMRQPLITFGSAMLALTAIRAVGDGSKFSQCVVQPQRLHDTVGVMETAADFFRGACEGWERARSSRALSGGAGQGAGAKRPPLKVRSLLRCGLERLGRARRFGPRKHQHLILDRRSAHVFDVGEVVLVLAPGCFRALLRQHRDRALDVAA